MGELRDAAAKSAGWVGRRADLSRLLELLRSRGLVALVGPPGVGKSRLAAEALRGITARGSAGDPPEPCVLVSLRGCRALDDAAIAVSTALSGSRGDLDSVRLELARRGRLVLLLDDADGVLDQLGLELPSWLAEAQELTLVVTVQKRDALPGARQLELLPLPLAEAVELFQLRWANASSGRTAALDLSVVEQICEELSRLPLALELAAARGAVLTPTQLLGRLKHHERLLLEQQLGGTRVSMLAALQTAWEALDERGQRALARCSVFSSSFPVEFAEAVLEGDDAVPLLAELMARSLVEQLTLDALPDEPRFRLYAPVRAFAALQLEQSGELEHTLALRDEHVLAAAEICAARLEGGDALYAERRLALCRDSLVEVLERSFVALPERAARAGLVLSELMLLRGISDTSLHERTAAAARTHGQAELLGRALIALGVAASRLGQIEGPLARLDEATQLLQGRWLARALLARGRFHAQHGSFDQAFADLGAARELLSQSDDAYALGAVRNVEGCVLEIRGDLDAALRAFEAARTLFRSCGSMRMEAAVVGNIGVVRHAQARLEDARSLSEQALELARRSENRVIEADSLLNLGSWYLTAGDLPRSVELVSEALVLQQRIGNRRFEGLCLVNLAMATHELGDLPKARDHYQRALEILHECGEARFEVMARPFFAAVEAQLGLLAEARSDLLAARVAPSGIDEASFLVVDVLSAIVDVAEARHVSSRHSVAPQPPSPGASVEESSGASEPELALAVAGAARKLEQARRQLMAAPMTSRGPELAVALRLATRALGELTRGRELASSGHRLRLDADGRWFALDQQPRVELARRGALRRILTELVEQHQRAPGRGLSALELFEAGWPGERVQAQAAVNRSYTAIKTLRQLGLDPHLQRQDDGYLLTPGLVIERPS